MGGVDISETWNIICVGKMNQMDYVTNRQGKQIEDLFCAINPDSNLFLFPYRSNMHCKVQNIYFYFHEMYHLKPQVRRDGTW